MRHTIRMHVCESLTDVKAAVLTEGFMSEVKTAGSKVRVGCWMAINRLCAGQQIY